MDRERETAGREGDSDDLDPFAAYETVLEESRRSVGATGGLSAAVSPNPAKASPSIHTLELPYSKQAPPEIVHNSERFTELEGSTHEVSDATRQVQAMVVNPDRLSSDKSSPLNEVGRLVERERGSDGFDSSASSVLEQTATRIRSTTRVVLAIAEEDERGPWP